MDWFRDNYFAAPTDRTDPRASPILADDLSGAAPRTWSPPASTRCATRARTTPTRCARRASPATLRREPDLVHGFINAVGLGGRAREAVGAIAAAISAGLAPGAVTRPGATAATLRDPPG